MAIIVIRDQPYEANPLNYVSCKLQPDRSNISCAQPMQAIVAGSELLTAVRDAKTRFFLCMGRDTSIMLRWSPKLDCS